MGLDPSLANGTLQGMNPTSPESRFPSRGLLVTGVDTGVGKTEVAAAITRELCRLGHRVGVYKPVASGADRLDATALDESVRAAVASLNWPGSRRIAMDAVRLWQAAGRPPGMLEQVCPQVFEAPLAPNLAARAEGRSVDAGLLRSGLERWTGNCDLVVVEGAGGLMSPISDEDYVADLALDLGYPLIVVAADRIGCINQTLQTLIAALSVGGASDGLSVAGVVLSETVDPDDDDDPSRASNAQELAARCVPPLLGRLPWKEDQIQPWADQPIDWLDLSRNETLNT